MRIVVKVSGFFEWIPVPPNVPITAQDIAAGKARPSANGTGHVMRVKIDKETETEIIVPEHLIIAQIIYAYTDKGKCGHILTRHEAAAEWVARTSAIEFPRKAIKSFEIHDDGPSEELMREKLKVQVEASHERAMGSNIDEEDVEDILDAYMAPAEHDEEHHVKMGASREAAKQAPHAMGASLAHARGTHDHLHAMFCRPKKTAAKKESDR